VNDINVPSKGSLKVAFEPETIVLALDTLKTDRPLVPAVFGSRKFLQVVASIAAIGLVEPVVVIREKDGGFRVLDGRLRVEAMRRLRIDEALCLVATDDETYTYNKHINKLTTAQDSRMIARAIERGVHRERIAVVLGIDTETVRRRSTLMNGICPEAIELLASKSCPGTTFAALRHMTAMRQLEAAELMCGQNNFGSTFARAILAASTPEQLVIKRRSTQQANGELAAQLARMEKELGKLQCRAGGMAETYGLEHLHLAVTSSYIANLMRNVSIATWLRIRYPEYFAQMERSAKQMESAKEPRRTMKLPYERQSKSAPAMHPPG
jgi:hypothetical protein